MRNFEGREQTSFQLWRDKHKPPHYGHDNQLLVTLGWSRDDGAYRTSLATALEIPSRNLRIILEWFHGDTLWRSARYGTAALSCATGGVRETCGPQISWRYVVTSRKVWNCRFVVCDRGRYRNVRSADSRECVSLNSESSNSNTCCTTKIGLSHWNIQLLPRSKHNLGYIKTVNAA
jgi:hypothetical protein